ncbi:DUF4058 family protein [Gemmata sp. JC673]|uniref:DUF4058 family protein n=1 Tax=Gemmata algarum TaxID=2975278 RepID=A0ABU5F4S5_9BACT|nr:DUF4058 domain-containing protein [Gemmata algarum]MDY3562310.1 DUF4058 family protein [Gemmata algarum]
MPLHDHFRPPDNRLPWEPLHSGWLSELAGRINERLPEGYVALDRVRIGGGLEIDLGVEELLSGPGAGSEVPAGGVATATTRATYAPPAASGSAEYTFPDLLELRVTSATGDGRVVGAVELVSPGNKDRGTKREAFVGKCLDYLAGGAAVVIVDVVTDRRANLHNDIAERVGAPSELMLSAESFLYAAAYRPVRRGKRTQIDIWVSPLAVGTPLPTMPLRLVGNVFIPVELEWAYVEACRRRRFVA